MKTNEIEKNTDIEKDDDIISAISIIISAMAGTGSFLYLPSLDEEMTDNQPIQNKNRA